MSGLGRARTTLLRRILPPPRHYEDGIYTMLATPEKDVGPTPRLLDVAMQAIHAARRVDLAPVHARETGPHRWTHVWPGEHYKLLAGLVDALQPRLVIDIGTERGLSAITLAHGLPAKGRVITYDLTPWTEMPHPALRHEDFRDGRLEQRTHNLADPDQFRDQVDDLRRADLIMIDASKDGATERAFIRNFSGVDFEGDPIVVFDDIRFWTMLPIWRGLARPKLDLTSFGHWTGTGLIDWNGAVPA